MPEEKEIIGHLVKKKIRFIEMRHGVFTVAIVMLGFVSGVDPCGCLVSDFIPLYEISRDDLDKEIEKFRPQGWEIEFKLHGEASQ